jgi:hypothetical protein
VAAQCGESCRRSRKNGIMSDRDKLDRIIEFVSQSPMRDPVSLFLTTLMVAY